MLHACKKGMNDLSVRYMNFTKCKHSQLVGDDNMSILLLLSYLEFYRLPCEKFFKSCVLQNHSLCTDNKTLHYTLLSAEHNDG